MIDAIVIGGVLFVVLSAVVGWTQAERLGIAPASLIVPAVVILLAMPLALWSMLAPTPGTDMGGASGYILSVFALIVASAAFLAGLAAAVVQQRIGRSE